MSAESDAAKEALAGEPGGKSHASQMVQLAADAGIGLFHDSKQVAWAAVTVDGRRETWRVRSDGFKTWLAAAFYTEKGKVAGGSAVDAALSAIVGRALHKGPQHDVHVRIAEHDGKLYLDLANADWSAVEIDSDGWRLVKTPPVHFRQPLGIAALPTPVRGGGIEELKPFMNVSCDWRLIVTAFLAALRTRGPFPVLWSLGEHGSAKSTLGNVLRALIDPRSAGGLRPPPRETRDLAVGAEHSWVLAFDNLSSIAEWFSDALCRLSTGGGFAIRANYTDSDEMLFEAMRPIVLNGITDVVTHLLDRALLAEHPPIPDDQRRSEEEFWAAFEAKRPAILEALLDAVSAGLRNLPTVELVDHPRMADFARWGVAVAPALGWTGEEFLAAYAENRRGAVATALEASPIAGHIQTLAAAGFTGNAQALRSNVELLAMAAGESTSRAAGFPQTARGMRAALDRIAASLRAIDVIVTFPAKTDKTRTITIRLADPAAGPEWNGPADTDSSDSAGECAECKRTTLLRRSAHLPDRAVCWECHAAADSAVKRHAAKP